ncbi:putative HTH-type transcriptional regulator YurK [Escherichia coli]|nr:putative HTH-type transcriptional regulator YurK [Escherichia coli]
MEQAHTQLIAQLNERILAADNTPLYIKFAETVKNAVRSGVLEHGNILPGERDLSQLTGVSRITVRKAMQALEEEGVVTRSRGYGTQINNIFEYSLKEARGFSQQVVLRGKKPDTLWVNKRVVKCPEEVAQQLAVEAGSDVFLLKRIRYVDEEAVSIEESWVPAHLIHDVDAIGISLYDYFRSQHIYPQRTRSRVSARMPDAEFQSHIQLDSKIPVLVIKWRLTNSNGLLNTALATVAAIHTFCVRGVVPRALAHNHRPDARQPTTPLHCPVIRHPPVADQRPARQVRHRHDCRPPQWCRQLALEMPECSQKRRC